MYPYYKKINEYNDKIYACTMLVLISENRIALYSTLKKIFLRVQSGPTLGTGVQSGRPVGPGLALTESRTYGLTRPVPV